MSKQQIVDKLTSAGQRLVKVRDRAAAIRNPLNQSEPEPIRTAQNDIAAPSDIIGQSKG